MRSFRELSVPKKVAVVLLSLKMNYRVLFGWKALLFLAGTAIYFTAFLIIASRADEPLTLGHLLAWLIWLPTTLFAVFFSMEIISREQETGMIETLFVVSVSIYRLWIVKFVVLMLFVSLLALALIVATSAAIDTLSQGNVDPFPITLTLLYILPPLVFFAGLTVLFSVVFKSGNAAGLCMAAVLGFVLLLSQDGISTTVIFPYLNPFDIPLDKEAFLWIRTVVYNKVAYFVLGGVWFWQTLRWLNRRERLLQ